MKLNRPICHGSRRASSRGSRTICQRWATMRELGLCSNPDTPISLTGTFDTKSDSLKNNQP
jgi:hypothetical protein